MKKKFLSVLTVLTILVSMITVFAEDTLSLTDGVGMSSKSEYSGVTISGTTAGSPSNGGWIKFENVDFGKTGIAEFMVNVAMADGYVGCALKFYIDNESSPFAELVVPSTGGWGKWAWANATVLNDTVFGVHSVTMRYTTSGPGDVKSFKMVPMQEEGGVSIPETIIGTAFEEKFEILAALGIVEWDGESNFDLTAELTAQTLVEAAMMLKNENDSEKIKEFLQKCSITGKDKITTEKACEVFVRLLGYDYAMLNGETFTQMADQIELDYITALDDVVTWEEAIRMLYSATEISPAVIVPKNSPTNNTLSTLEVYENNTMLIEHRDIYKSKGVVTMTSATGLDDVSTISDNQVLIGNYIFEVGECNVLGLLGYAVEYYYHEGDYDNTLLYIKKSKRNSITELKAKDILDYSDNRVVCEIDGKEKTINIPDNAKLIYNGLATSKFDDSMFNMNSGSMEIISNNGDSAPDVVKLWNTTDYMTDGVFDDILYLRTADDKKINLDDANNKVDLTNAVGKAIDASKIKEDTVVTIAEVQAIDGSFTLYTITNVNNTVSGTVQYASSSSEMLRIDGEGIPMSTDFAKGAGANIKTGQTIKVYLNKYGEAAFTETSISTDLIGYVVKSYLDDNDDAYVRIFTEKGEMIDYLCYEKIYIDGVKANNAQSAHDLLQEDKLVIFSTNNKGEIRKINFSKPNSDTGDDNGLYYYGNITGQYKANVGALGGKYVLSNDFIRFQIPQESTDYQNYVVTSSRFVNDSNVTMECYNKQKGKLDVSVGLQKYNPAKPEVSLGIDVCYVVDKEIALSKNDEVVTMLTYYNGIGKQLEQRAVSVTNSSVADTLKIGDGIRFETDIYDEIVGLKRLFSPADSTVIDTGTEFAARSRIAKGNVYKKQDSIIKLDGGDGEVINCASVVVYVLDDDKVEIGSLSDIYDSDVKASGSEVYIYLKYGEAISLIVKK